jgi:hypothetical protein
MALSDAEQREVLDLLRWVAAPNVGELRKKFRSRSPLRRLGETEVDTITGFGLNVDSSEHIEIMELLGSKGHKPTLAQLWDVANADPVQYPDRQGDREIAQLILADVTSAPAAVTNAATQAPQGPDFALSMDAKQRELAAAYAEIARLREENYQLQQAATQAAQAPSTELATVGPAALTTGESAAGVIDAGQEWAKTSLAMDKVQQHAFDASLQLLRMQTNGTEQ